MKAVFRETNAGIEYGLEVFREDGEVVVATWPDFVNEDVWNADETYPVSGRRDTPKRIRVLSDIREEARRRGGRSGMSVVPNENEGADDPGLLQEPEGDGPESGDHPVQGEEVLGDDEDDGEQVDTAVEGE